MCGSPNFQVGPLILRSCSVPARLGKGHGAEEIVHNLASERPEFGHNLVHERQTIGHSLERERPSHFYAQTPKNSGTVKHANETRSGHNFFFFFSIRYANQAGGKGVRAGRKTARAECSTLRNMPRWNTKLVVPLTTYCFSV